FGLADDRAGIVDALVGLAKVLERSDRAGEAYRRLNTALRHDPDNLGIRSAMVRNRHQARRWRDVVTMADKLEQLVADGRQLEGIEPRQVGTIYTYAALAEQELKHDGEAKVRLDKALEVDPVNIKAIEHFIPLLQRRGETERAAELCERRAELSESKAERAEWGFRAGLAFNEAAVLLRTTREDGAPSEAESELRKKGFSAL